MWKNKEIKSISGSSVLDLKKELFKATDNFDKTKRKSSTNNEFMTGKKIKKPSNKIKESNISIHRPQIEEKDDSILLEESFIALQKKGIEYQERLEKVDDSDDDVLVDFLMKRNKNNNDHDNKNNSSQTKIDKEINSTLENNNNNQQHQVNKPNQETDILEDPWIEIKDAFGRTRVIRKSTIPSLPQNPFQDQTSFQPTIQTYIQDKKTHYSDVKEIRTMGVSHFKFSKIEEERKDQLNELKQLRDETISSRKLSHLVKQSKMKKIQDRRNFIQQKSKSIDDQKSRESNIDSLFESK